MDSVAFELSNVSLRTEIGFLNWECVLVHASTGDILNCRQLSCGVPYNCMYLYNHSCIIIAIVLR